MTTAKEGGRLWKLASCPCALWGEGGWTESGGVQVSEGEELGIPGDLAPPGSSASPGQKEKALGRAAEG